MIEGQTMAEMEAQDRADEITPEMALNLYDAVKQLGRLDARGLQLRRPDRIAEIPSRANDLHGTAARVYGEGFLEERRRQQRESAA